MVGQQTFGSRIHRMLKSWLRIRSLLDFAPTFLPHHSLLMNPAKNIWVFIPMTEEAVSPSTTNYSLWLIFHWRIMGEKMMSKEYMLGDFFEKYMEENDIVIYLADCEPEGMVANVSVQIGDHFIPTDFYVIRYTVERKIPILFGRPFLAVAGAVINVKEKKVVLNFEKESIELQMDQPGILFTTEKRVNHMNELSLEKKPPSKKRKRAIQPPNAHPEDATP